MLGQDVTPLPSDIGSVTVPGQANDSLGWLEQLTGAGQTLIQLDYLKQINDINLQRAAQGLPPISAAEYAPTVNVGASPATLQAGGLGLLALIAGGIVIALLVAKK
jgi:hypothetical protein